MFQFHQQVTRFDCVPTSFVNAMVYLFDRKEIPPTVLQRIYLYTLDTVARKNELGHGSSRYSVELLSHWLNNYKHESFNVVTKFISGMKVHLGGNNAIALSTNGGGVALLRVRRNQSRAFHYVLVLKTSDSWLYCYDSYPTGKNIPGGVTFSGYADDEEYLVDADRAIYANVRISYAHALKPENGAYSMGEPDERECLLVERGKNRSSARRRSSNLREAG